MKYEIIYADPPWSYADKASAGSRGAAHKYDLMTDYQIERLPVESIAADDCVLFMWATFPRLDLALRVMRAWGFEYKTAAFVWVKTNRVQPSLFMGMGNWTRANAEIVLLGVKGRPKRVNASIRQIVQEPIREHSQKPHEVRQRIVDLMGDRPRVELFAREASTGWDIWGNQAPGSIALFGQANDNNKNDMGVAL